MTETEEKTEFKFEELSDKAKEKARDKYRAYGQDYEWWDAVYEDAVRMAALIGIEIGTDTRLSARGTTYRETSIYFSGFCSQGDGACFEGNYRFKPGAVEAITSETNDEELIRIATELQTLQLTRRLLGLEYFWANIRTSGREHHSGSMEAEVCDNSGDEDESHLEGLDTEVTQLMRDFADWIYSNLEAEDEYLNSDETIDEQLVDSDKLFDEDGDEI